MGVRRAETGEHERELETCMKCIRMAECIHLITSKSKCGKEIVFEPGSNMNKTKPRDIRKRAIYIYVYCYTYNTYHRNDTNCVACITQVPTNGRARAHKHEE